MRIEHRSGLGIFKEPYGAVPTGTKVKLRICILPAGQFINRVQLCYSYGLYQFFHNTTGMRKVSAMPALPGNLGSSSNHWYEIDIVMPLEPALFFYCFRIDTDQGQIWVVPDYSSSSGTNLISQEPYLPNPLKPFQDRWQITVFSKELRVPNWLPGAVFYQIFPDRFARGQDYSVDKMRKLCALPERIFHTAWDSPVDFQGNSETGYIATDFYGGTLKGITEKLPYLKELGVDVIYLNPIFKARSNHRYDTGDYEQIDPMLGTQSDLEQLCEEAKKLGIRLMLDGVFSHTGADSRYFNLHGRYPEAGAVQSIKENLSSPWSSWYDLYLHDGQLSYESWWGFTELPNVKELDLSYLNYITGPEGLSLNGSNWACQVERLDVSDELPDSFIRAVRHCLEREDPQAALLGEVWEDASSKHSYGSYRDFIFGRTHHQIMGYPFRESVVKFLRGNINAETMLRSLEIIREHYPLPIFYTNLNLISSHDTVRAITALAGVEDPCNRELQSRLELTDGEREMGEKLLLLAYVIQTCYPGCSSIYYGDERAVEGTATLLTDRPFLGVNRNRN